MNPSKIKQSYRTITYFTMSGLFLSVFFFCNQVKAENFRDQEDRMRAERHQQEEAEREAKRNQSLTSEEERQLDREDNPIRQNSLVDSPKHHRTKADIRNKNVPNSGNLNDDSGLTDTVTDTGTEKSASDFVSGVSDKSPSSTPSEGLR